MKIVINMPAFKIKQVNYVTKQFQLHDTMVLLKVLLQIFSLDIAERRITRGEKYLYIFKCVVSSVIIGLWDAYSLLWKIKHIFSALNPSIVITDVTQMTYDYVQYIIDLIFIYKYGRETIVEYLKNYDCIDQILDTNHNKEIRSRLLRLTTMLLFLWFVVSAFDFSAWFLGYGLETPVFYSIAYFFLLFKILTNLDLTVQVFNVECRLRVIGDLLQDCCNSTEFLPSNDSRKNHFTDTMTNKNWFYVKGCTRAKDIRIRNHPLKEPSNDEYHNVKWLSRCYLLLGEQSTFINKMFGVRIMLNSLSLLIDMVRFLNVVVRISIGSQETTYNNSSGYLPAISTFMRFMLCVAFLASLVYHCERVYENTNHIINVTDHILINKNPDEGLKSSLLELKSLVTSKPISFNMCNFFRLSYPFLISMISTVVTYTIILLQNT